MIVYWSGTLLSCALMWLYTHAKYRSSRTLPKIIAAFAVTLPLILIGGIRYGVGSDYPTYEAYYHTICEGLSSDKFEWLYYCLNKFLAVLGCSSPWLFLVTTALFMVFTTLQILEDSPYPVVSLFLVVGMTYYFISFNAVRQMIGCAILLFSIRYIEKKNFFMFLVCILTAMGMHKALVVFLPAYFFDKVKINWKTATLITAAMMVLSGPIVSIMNYVISSGIYRGYLTSKYNTAARGNVVILINVSLTIFTAIFYRRNNKIYDLYFKMQLAAMWLSTLSGRIVLSERLRWIYGLPSVILVPMAIRGIPDKNLRVLALLGIVLMYAMYFSYTVGILNSNLVLPYQTVFFRGIV